MSRIRVGMNLLWLLPGVAGGAERYAIRLLRALADEARDDVDVTILCNRRFPAAHGELTARYPTAVAPIDGASRALRIAKYRGRIHRRQLCQGPPQFVTLAVIPDNRDR